MHAVALFIALALCGQLAPDDIPAEVEPPPLPVVEQTVECISIAHMENYELVFVWDMVQEEFALLDYKWITSDKAVHREDDEWVLSFVDDEWNENRCFRVIRTKCWVESWERESPLAANNNKAWFLQVGGPGLKAPPVVRR